MQPRDLSGHGEYQAGRGAEAVARDLGIDPDDLLTLASNENQLGPSPAAADAIREAAGDVHTYPKSSHVDLQAAVADRWSVAPEQVWIANGADGALDYLARAVLDPGDPVLVPDPGFAYYAMSVRFHHGRPWTYPVRKADDFALTAETVLDHYTDERIVYLTTPHSPTGREFDPGAVERIAAGTDTETLTVVDEAYGEFTETPSARRLLGERNDVAVLRTFSKAYGLAGVRLGYALVPTGWADAYARVNTPFAASEIACRAGLAALNDDEHLRESVETARWGRDYMRSELRPSPWPCGGNFVLAVVGGGRAAGGDAETPAASVAAALRERGVIVRDCTSFGLPDCVRITCGTRDGTRRAVAAVNEVVAAPVQS
jgi:histidinol-phosphate aminotransferase